jgi:hypothetical protein
MKKVALMTAFLFLVGGLVLAQTEPEPEPEVETPEVETPEQNGPPVEGHGKTISELAKATPGGPEKGKIISSAARQKGMQQSAAARGLANRSDTGMQASEAAKNLRPSQAGQPAEPGKPAVLPPVTAPTKGKPAGLPGGN